MDSTDLICQTDGRRDLVRRSGLRAADSRFFGMDFLEVSQDQLTLTVYFLGRAPQKIAPANLRIQGGERITDIQVTGVTMKNAADAELDDSMLVTVNQPGDFSTYCLSVRALDEQGRPTDTPPAGFDPRYAAVEFTFKAGCPSDLDCAAPMVCPPSNPEEPEINYLAKDYNSFRQIILDRLGSSCRAGRKPAMPVIGVALVEVLAYVGDHLSYIQDALATEA